MVKPQKMKKCIQPADFSRRSIRNFFCPKPMTSSAWMRSGILSKRFVQRTDCSTRARPYMVRRKIPRPTATSRVWMANLVQKSMHAPLPLRPPTAAFS